MTLEYDCPHCHYSMTVERDAAGREFVCPGCRVFFTLPVPLRMTKREARSLLLPSAVWLSIQAGVYLLICGVGIAGLVYGYMLVGGDLLKDLLIPLGIWCLVMVPGVVLVVGARAMFRAENRWLALIGICVSFLLSLLCCFCMLPLGYGFLISPPILSDPLLFQAMDEPE